jgi:hypothetical protein
MESKRTQERIEISAAERDTLHSSLRASGVEIEEVEDTSVDPPVPVTRLDHGVFIIERKRVLRGREKTRIEAVRARKKSARQQADQSRRRNRSG